MDVLVSLIVPIFQSRPYLDELLDSLERQDFDGRYECLLLDFGSTDGSAALCVERERRNPALFRYYRSDVNYGVCATRNAGILLARGTYVAFVDSDDVLERDFLSVLYSLARKDDLDLAIGGYDILRDGRKTRGYSRENRRGTGRSFLLRLFRDPFQKERTFVWGRLFRRAMLRENRIAFDTSLTCFEDLPFTYAVLLSAKRVRAVRRPVYDYRQNDLSTMAKTKRGLLEKHVQAFLKGREVLRQGDPALERKLFSRKWPAIALQLRYDARVEGKAEKITRKEEKRRYRNAIRRLFKE